MILTHSLHPLDSLFYRATSKPAVSQEGRPGTAAICLSRWRCSRSTTWSRGCSGCGQRGISSRSHPEGPDSFRIGIVPPDDLHYENTATYRTTVSPVARVAVHIIVRREGDRRLIRKEMTYDDVREPSRVGMDGGVCMTCLVGRGSLSVTAGTEVILGIPWCPDGFFITRRQELVGPGQVAGVR